MCLPDPARGRREEVHKVRRQEVHTVNIGSYCRREPRGWGGLRQDKARSFATGATFAVHVRGWGFHYKHDQDTAQLKAVSGVPCWQVAAFMGPGRCTGRGLQ